MKRESMSDHQRSVRDHVLMTARFIAANPEATEAELVDGLCGIGYQELEAELLVALVPLGMARAVIRRLPQPEPVELSDHAIVLKDGRELILRLIQVPEFVEAERLGEETFTTGIIQGEDFAIIGTLSVELNLVNKMLFAGTTPDIISSPVLIRLGDAEGFEGWYEQIKGPSLL